MVNSLNRNKSNNHRMIYKFQEKHFVLLLTLLLLFNNLYSQNEYSQIDIPLIGNIITINHQDKFKKYNTSINQNSLKIFELADYRYRFSYINTYICDQEGNKILSLNQYNIVNRFGNLIRNGDILKKLDLEISYTTYNNTIFIRNLIKNNIYYFICLTTKNELLIFTIIKKNNDEFEILENYKALKDDNYLTFAITHNNSRDGYWIVLKLFDNKFKSIYLDSLGNTFINQIYSSKNKSVFDKIDVPTIPYCRNISISQNSKFILYYRSFNPKVIDDNLPLFYIYKFNNSNGEINEIPITSYYSKEDNSFSKSLYTSGHAHWPPYFVEFSNTNTSILLKDDIGLYEFIMNCDSTFLKLNSIKYINILEDKEMKLPYFYLNLYQNSNNCNFVLSQKVSGLGSDNNDEKFITFNISKLSKSTNLISKFEKNYFSTTLTDIENPNLFDIHNIGYNQIKNNVVNSTFYQVRTDGIHNKCIGDNFNLDCEVLYSLPDTNYMWRGPNNFNSTLKNPFKNGITKKDEGIYTVVVFDKANTTLYKGYIELIVNEIPKFEIITTGKKILCDGDSIRLYCDTPYDRYLWSNGDTTRFTYVKEAGEVSLTAFVGHDCNECGTTKKITIEKVFTPQFNLTKFGEECGTVEITLKSDVEFPTSYKYLWNTGAITPELKVSKNGVYTLIVTDTNGCQTSKSIEIIFGKKPIAEIKAMGATTFCEGGRVELRATGGMSSNDLNFEWSTGEKVPNIWVDQSGVYKVVITHKFSNCVDSAEIEIKVNPNLVSKIEQIGTLCKGGEVTLNAQPQDTDYKYLWSNGATTPSIKVSQAGKYTVEVSLDGTCKSSAEIEVIANQAQDFEILADGKYCVGDSVMLSPSKKFKEYLWSTGDMTEKKGVTKSGTYKLIVIDENGCTNEKSIDVEFISPREYKLDFTDYDFGNVEIGTEKRVKVNIPGEIGFKLRGDFPLDINTMEMVFKPDTERDYSGEIVLNYGGDCDTTATITFKGKGVNSVIYKAKVIAPKVTTEAGLDNVELPIKFEINDENMTYPFELDYKIKLSLNYDVYIPQIPSTINGTKREIEVAGKVNITKGENILTTIKGKTYLSQDFENEIKILIFEHNTDKLSVKQEDGYLNITGICVPDLRGLNFFTPTTMTVSPNPVSSDLTIKINTEEIGQHKLRLVDITGNSREVGDFEVKELTEKVLKLNAKELSKGQYFLELITPNQTITEIVIVD